MALILLGLSGSPAAIAHDPLPDRFAECDLQKLPEEGLWPVTDYTDDVNDIAQSGCIPWPLVIFAYDHAHQGYHDGVRTIVWIRDTLAGTIGETADYIDDAIHCRRTQLTVPPYFVNPLCWPV